MSLFKVLVTTPRTATSIRGQYFFTRNQHDDVSQRLLVPLKRRSLIKVSGAEASNLLQGVITNDMRNFEHMSANAKSLYALFLNDTGKILYDALIYKWFEDNTFLIECDNRICANLKDYLTIKKLKKNGIEIEDIQMYMRLWALFSPSRFIADDDLFALRPVNVFKDPRLPELGYRVIADTGLSESELLEMFDCQKGQVQLEEEDVYKYLRYRLGVPEGTKDISPGEYYATEANGDVLNGLSLLKGCYTGSDITERMQLTRKIESRMLPLQLPEPACIDRSTAITTATNPLSRVGKVVASMHDICLGTINIHHALMSKKFKVGEVEAEILKPAWFGFTEKTKS